MSNMYSLLNYIAATSKDIFDSSSAHSHGYSLHSHPNPHSLETGLRGLSEDEKRLVGISTISAVTRLALEFKMEEVYSTIIQTSVLLTPLSGHQAHNFNAIAAASICGTHSRGSYSLQPCGSGSRRSSQCLQRYCKSLFRDQPLCKPWWPPLL